MEKTVANYRVIIEKEKYANGKTAYVASVPTLRIYDYAPTIEKLLESVRDGIKLAVECLAKSGAEVPVDSAEQIIVNTQVEFPRNFKVSFA